MLQPILRVERLGKDFVLHQQGEARIQAYQGVSLELSRGECLVIKGPSGCGKSSLLRQVYGNYRTPVGRILLRTRESWTDLACLDARSWIGIRRDWIGYVSQFLRAIPRTSALDVVAEPGLRAGIARADARESAAGLLRRLGLPERLWSLPPATFSGGEQQRINIARGFASSHPVLLLDEPTASLDADNRARVVELIRERCAGGVAVLGIFHDPDVRDRVATRIFDMPRTEEMT